MFDEITKVFTVLVFGTLVGCRTTAEDSSVLIADGEVVRFC